MEWFYTLSGKKIGPLPEDELLNLVATKAIPEDTLVWQEGMSDWEKFSSLGFTVETEKLEGKVYLKSGPWRRYFARMFDTTSFGLIGGMIFGFFMYVINPELADKLFENSAVSAILVVGIGLSLDAVIYTLFGTTPGKSLAKLRVIDINGNAISAEQYMRRNGRLMVYGFGLGVPLISLFTMSAQYNNIKKGDYAGYDKETKHDVSVSVINGSPPSIGPLVFAYITVVFISFLIGLWGEENGVDATQISSAPNVLDDESPMNILNDSLAEDARLLSRDLPMMVDDETQLVKVTSGYLLVNYHYVLTEVSIDGVDLSLFDDVRSGMFKGLAEDACSNEYLVNLLDQNVSVKYTYADSNNEPIWDFSIHKSDCSA
jgi:hypothetical protein